MVSQQQYTGLETQTTTTDGHTITDIMSDGCMEEFQLQEHNTYTSEKCRIT